MYKDTFLLYKLIEHIMLSQLPYLCTVNMTQVEESKTFYIYIYIKDSYYDNKRLKCVNELNAVIFKFPFLLSIFPKPSLLWCQILEQLFVGFWNPIKDDFVMKVI